MATQQQEASWKRIVVGLDSSDRAPLVLRRAADLARAAGSKLTLVRAYSIPVGVPPEAFAYIPEQLQPMLERDARSSLETLARQVSPEIIAKLLTPLGVAWEQICDAAEREHADLIVIGSHGYGALDRLLGTTAARVVNHAKCSVLVVRNPSEK